MDIDVMEREFEPAVLKSRKGSYGKMLTYAPAREYIRRMNEAFDYDWSLDVASVDRGKAENDEDEVIAVVKVSAGGVVKTQAGSKRVVRNDDGIAFALGDDTKSAITDGFKKCCQYFGIGLHLMDEDDAEAHGNGDYRGRSQERTRSRTVGGITDKHLGFIRDLRTELGWSQDDVRSLADRLFGTDDVPSLNPTQASTLISEIRKHKAAASREDRSQAASY